MRIGGHALRLPFLTPVQGVPKSPRIAAIPSARSPISRRLYFFQRCPWSICQGRKTSASPPLFFQRPFLALICTQHGKVAAPPSASICPRLAPRGSGGSGPRRRARFGRSGENKKNSRLAPPLRPQNHKDNREFENLYQFCGRWHKKYRLFRPPVNRSKIKKSRIMPNNGS